MQISAVDCVSIAATYTNKDESQQQPSTSPAYIPSMPFLPLDRMYQTTGPTIARISNYNAHQLVQSVPFPSSVEYLQALHSFNYNSPVAPPVPDLRAFGSYTSVPLPPPYCINNGPNTIPALPPLALFGPQVRVSTLSEITNLTQAFIASTVPSTQVFLLFPSVFF